MHAVGIRLEPGDHMIYRSNGGGGFGNPLDRDPERVSADVELGWISREKANAVYGVVLRADESAKDRYVIDLNATTVMREQMAKETRVRGYGPGEVHPLGELIQVAEVALAAE
jgi:N-methylhydantoinase B/oxoprolinase/acetone carboxylase alpha subunit